jgi:hypothetical protein
MTDSHTRREARILELTLGGLETMRKHERDTQFCFGSAWATLNLILNQLGEPRQKLPLPEYRTDDEVTRG